ncbi:hypothetical protein WG904_19210 [Pedobacter sp. Du54]|uniref:hypothetical protein n=1 Tax=Pedobacter anseongensis TaxID=3133439 RepID=UPI00309BE785
MLQQFTWQDFLIAALIFTLVWYVVIILLYYRSEFFKFLSGRNNTQPPEKLRREWEEEFEDDEQDNLIGRQALPEGLSEISMSNFGFAQKGGITDEKDNKEIQLGLVPDVLEELKSIFSILKKENGGKEDFISLFALISSKYPNIRNTGDSDEVDHPIPI